MKHLLQFLVLIMVLASCSKQSELRKNFNCNNINSEQKSEQYDFHKNFKLNIPSNWKTTLYYNNYQSEIISADTVKQLTNTYILDASYNLGTIEFSNKFHSKNDSILKAKNLKIIKSNTTLFQNKPSFWYVANGAKNGFDYHQFNITVLLSQNTYFNCYIEVYGDKNIDERFCDAISILENIEFLE
ncbi:hypothetical protein ACFQ5N_08785 [Lutibacter holmesii]|uniref:Lipoprotein n=1 Tax=Lutibacter holmesii TaxID=1137985 RepID=A0ABW3WP44_9FLAO